MLSLFISTYKQQQTKYEAIKRLLNFTAICRKCLLFFEVTKNLFFKLDLPSTSKYYFNKPQKQLKLFWHFNILRNDEYTKKTCHSLHKGQFGLKNKLQKPSNNELKRVRDKKPRNL